MENIKTAYGYIRVSTETQADRGYGLDIQENALKEYCKQHNIQLIKIFKDEGITGKLGDTDDITIRPALNEMIALLSNTNEPPKTIIVMNTSRLWRDDMARATISRLLKNAKVDVIATEQPRYSLYSKDPQDFLFNSVMEALDIYERMTINIKLANGKKERVKQGKTSNGIVPYGYNIINDNSIIVPEEAEIVKQIYNLALTDNMGIYKIAKYLKNKKIQTKNNKYFSESQIFNILTNPYYIGKIYYQNKLYDGIHESIITEEIWNKVNLKYHNKKYNTLK